MDDFFFLKSCDPVDPSLRIKYSIYKIIFSMRSILGDDICLHGEQICQIEKMKKNFKTLSINENGWQKKKKLYLTFRLRKENAIINTWLGQLKMSTEL